MVADVLVVGGGVVGRTVAWRLAVAGAEVSWLAPAELAGTATAASGAMLSIASEVAAHLKTPAHDADLRCRSEGRRLWGEWLPQLHDATGVDPHLVPGSFVVANSVGRDDAAEMAAIRAAARAVGGRAEDVSAEDVPGLDPDPAARAFDAVYLPDEATVDSGRLLASLGAVLDDTGVRRVTDAAVKVDVDDASLVVHCQSGDRLVADHVVLATGAGTDELLVASGLEDVLPPVWGGRGVSVVVRAPTRLPNCVRTPNRAFACGLHLVPRADGLTYLGATNRLSTAPDLGRLPTLGEIATVVGDVTRELSGSLRHAELVSTAVGHRPVTVDRLPLVGRSAVPRLLAATATWRNGVVLAPVIAELIVDELLHPGATAEHPYTPTRPLPATNIDPDALRRGARGIVAGLADGGTVAPGRIAELEAFVEAALGALTGHAEERQLRTLRRLMERAPLEEVLPLVFEAAARQQR